jgi:hypothetical protein
VVEVYIPLHIRLIVKVPFLMFNDGKFRVIKVCRMTLYGGSILVWLIYVGKSFVTFKPLTKVSSYV